MVGYVCVEGERLGGEEAGRGNCDRVEKKVN